MRVLIDTNVALDFLLQREPFSQDAEMLFQAIDRGEVVVLRLLSLLGNQQQLTQKSQK